MTRVPARRAQVAKASGKVGACMAGHVRLRIMERPSAPQRSRVQCAMPRVRWRGCLSVCAPRVPACSLILSIHLRRAAGAGGGARMFLRVGAMGFRFGRVRERRVIERLVGKRQRARRRGCRRGRGSISARLVRGCLCPCLNVLERHRAPVSVLLRGYVVGRGSVVWMTGPACMIGMSVARLRFCGRVRMLTRVRL